jgi:WD40 repeat protein
LQFDPTGERLVSASWDMKLRLWDLETQTVLCIFDGHTGEAADCDVSLDGRQLASASWDSTARIWDLVNRRRDIGLETKTLVGHTERVLCCSFSPDGNYVATGSADQTVRIWPLERTGEPRILFGHPNSVTAIRFSPDGRWLLSADRDGGVFFWDAAEGRALGSIRHDRAILTLAIAPDSTQAIIGDEAGFMRFLELRGTPGPKWIAPHTTLKAPPIWKRGAPATESFTAVCVYCGYSDPVKPDNLGEQWQCKKCGETLRLCPRGLPPTEA